MIILKNAISIITPVYKPDKHLFDVCCRSMLNQINKKFKWLIGFDGEASYHRALKCPHFLQVKDEPWCDITINKNNKGVSKMRNILLDKVNVGFVGFLDADNWVTEDYIDYIEQAIDQCPESERYRALFFIGQVVRAKQQHVKIDKFYALNYRKPTVYNCHDLFPHNRVDLGQVVHAVSPTIRFWEDLDRLVDWDYILELIYNKYLQCPLDDIYPTFYDDMKRNERISSVKDYERNRKKILIKWSNKGIKRAKEVFQEDYGQNMLRLVK